MRVNMFIIKLICLFSVFFFLRSISDISVMEKFNIKGKWSKLITRAMPTFLRKDWWHRWITHMWCMDVCFDINRRFFIRTSKYWLRLNCSYFFCDYRVKLFLNCSCSIDVFYCFAHLLCVFSLWFVLRVLKSLFALVFADVTGIRMMDTFLGGNVTSRNTRDCLWS